MREAHALGNRGRREGRALAAPVARLQKKSRRQLPQVWPRHPGLPCAMVLTLIARSPWEPGFYCSHRPRDHHLATLASASGGQDHTPSRPHQRRSSARQSCASPTRPPHPAPNVRDDREAPLRRVRNEADRTSDSRKRQVSFRKSAHGRDHRSRPVAGIVS